MGQVVDTVTAKEFMAETLNRVDTDELGPICTQVQAKSELFRQRLAPAALSALSRDEFGVLLRRIFSTRGKVRPVLEGIEWPVLRSGIQQLLYGDGPVQAGVGGFVDIPHPPGTDLLFKLVNPIDYLHLTQPSSRPSSQQSTHFTIVMAA